MERKQASDYPQELLNLFDRYVHGEIERRDFLDGAKRFAVGGVTAMAIWESLRPNYAWAQQVPKDDSRIRTEYATVASPEGNGSIKGYLVRPAGHAEKLPGVLAPWLTGFVVDRTGEFYLAFVVAAGFALAGAGMFIFGVGPIEPVSFRRTQIARTPV